jgi:glutamate carboxypeptidase
VTIRAEGKAAHAGAAHDKGRNALWSLARWIDRAQQLTDYARGTTVNVGRVEGGIGKNTVPDRAMAEVDFRCTSREEGERVLALMHDLARTCAVEGTTLTLHGGLARSPLEQSPQSALLCDRYAQCQRASGLGDGVAPLIGGGSDASTTADAGVPSIDGLGPRGEGFHTHNEYADLSTLLPKAEALVRFLTTTQA